MILRQVVSEEVKDGKNNVRILNYCPGGVDSDMCARIINDPKTDEKLRQMMIKLRETGELRKPEIPAKILIQILLEDQYQNCQFIDYLNRKPF